ncbi:MAG: hypothetical protein AB8B69_07800 [Chitinophagales bacterium]
MAYEIEWTPTAENQYREIVHYIAETWSVDIVILDIEEFRKPKF